MAVGDPSIGLIIIAWRRCKGSGKQSIPILLRLAILSSVSGTLVHPLSITLHLASTPLGTPFDYTCVLCSLGVTQKGSPTTRSVATLVRRTTDEGPLHASTRILRFSSVPAGGCGTSASAALLLLPVVFAHAPYGGSGGLRFTSSRYVHHTPRSSPSIRPMRYARCDLSLQARHISRAPYKWPVRSAATHWSAPEVV